MIVDLTPAEKICIATIMRRMTWGGTSHGIPLLAAQVGLYEKLGLDAFQGDVVPTVDSAPVDLGPNESAILHAVCNLPGQDQATAMVAIGILRRLVATAVQAPPVADGVVT